MKRLTNSNTDSIARPPKLTAVGNTLAPDSTGLSGQTWLETLAGAFGVKNRDVAAALVSELISSVTKATPENLQLINSTLSKVCEIQPTDATEAMLAVQMVTCHSHIMKLMERVTKSGDPTESRGAEACLKLAARLMRTYTLQMQALCKYRRNGDQKIVVEHVTVEAGGQAIVGHIEQGGQG